MTKKNVRLELGLLLAIFATYTAVILKEVLRIDSSMLTYVMYVVTLLALFDFSIFKRKDMHFSRIMVLVILFQFYLLGYAVITGMSLFGSDQAIVYTVYVLCLIFALHTNTRPIQTQVFTKMLLCLSSVLNTLTFFLLSNFIEERTGDSIQIKILTYGADRATLAFIPFFYILLFLACNLHKRKNKLLKIYLYVNLIMAFYNIFACDRRSIYIMIICSIAYIVYKRFRSIAQVSRSFAIRCTLGVFAGLILLAVLFAIPSINIVLMESIDSLVSGLQTLFGDGGDAAVSMRNENRAITFADLYANTFWQWIVGRGYAYRHIDFPYLQALTDLGILGGLVYAYFFLVLPAKTLFTKVKYSEVELFIIGYMLVATLSGFISGTPYGHSKYTPLVLFVYIIVNNDKERKALQYGQMAQQQNDALPQ